VPLLVGTDGVHKMSQSLGNYISVRDDANEMFGKTMSIPDDLMEQWARLAAGLGAAEIHGISQGLTAGTLVPVQVKRHLARSIVERYHGTDASNASEAAFDAVFKEKGTPADIPTARLVDGDPIWLPRALCEAGLTASNSEARRLIGQGAVKIDGVRIKDEDLARSAVAGRVVQVGKRRFVRFR